MRINYYKGFILLFLTILNYHVVFGANPKRGFTQVVSITEDNVEVETPEGIPSYDRSYTYKDGIRCFWVYLHDKPIDPLNPYERDTLPRTKAQIKGHYYLRGVHQFESQVFVPKTMQRVTTMRIPHSPLDSGILELRVINGQLVSGSNELIAKKIRNKWFQLNGIHDADMNKIRVFIDADLKLETTYQSRPTDCFCFKFGVYPLDRRSITFLESRWRGIRILTRTLGDSNSTGLTSSLNKRKC